MEKALLLKLGGACNLKCKHCHCAQSSYELNNDIFDYINREGFSHVTFGGGEPLLYFDTIKSIIEKLPPDTTYKLVSNGTKLTGEMVEFFNTHNVKVVFSYDGENSSRDMRYLQRWTELAKMERQGLATLFSEDNKNTAKLMREITRLREKYGLMGQGSSLWVNFPHQTEVNANTGADRELAQEYCKFIARQIELDFRRFKKSPERSDLSALHMGFNHWLKKRTVRGVRCFREDMIVLALNGDFLLCPYQHKTVGNIYTGVDWEAVEAAVPERCRRCAIWESCYNSCVVNVTDNECYIAKVMHKHFLKLLVKYDVSYEQLAERFARRKAIPSQTE